MDDVSGIEWIRRITLRLVVFRHLDSRLIIFFPREVAKKYVHAKSDHTPATTRASTAEVAHDLSHSKKLQDLQDHLVGR